MPQKLRAVGDGEKAGPRTVAEAASTGTTRELLVALRDRIARTVSDPKCPPRDLSSLSRRLHELVTAIEALDAEAEDGDTSEVSDEAFDPQAL